MHNIKYLALTFKYFTTNYDLGLKTSRLCGEITTS